ncbi:MAG: SH3 domain-containing protein [Candidatus Acidiferrum sp.]
MSSKLWLVVAFAGVAVTLPSAAATHDGSPVTLVPPFVRSPVVCRGVQNVPVTADAEQALPLHLVASLNCGDQVAIVSDSSGYTVEVSTPDGKTGYVARMYLSASLARPLAPPQPVEAAANPNGIARWQLGAPGTDHFYNGPAMVESLTANGITVQVSLQDTGWKLRANVAIANASNSQVHFDPSTFTLDELTPRLRPLRYQNPESLSKSPTHFVYATKSSAIAPASAVYVSATTHTRRVIIAAPNFLADQSQPDQASALVEATLSTGEKSAGSVWFERAKNSHQLNLRIFVDNQIFEFPLSFPRHN